ncbi:50S ribosomal protein L18 [Geodia barretti]|uniref:Large ribosomal subunit protein uL18c n=1 Tax=Geodia barretti TaxID=519541 RepID=A0AA35W7W0_GEOBA|nr:50S ribosomal protein L18 [Geodia barretti]
MMRHKRVRRKITGTSGRPRMAVFRSLNHIYVQVIDDSRGHTVAAASSLEPVIRENLNNGAPKSDVSAMRATEQGVKGVVFDRGGFKYHGRTKALADAAREGGLVF